MSDIIITAPLRCQNTGPRSPAGPLPSGERPNKQIQFLKAESGNEEAAPARPTASPSPESSSSLALLLLAFHTLDRVHRRRLEFTPELTKVIHLTLGGGGVGGLCQGRTRRVSQVNTRNRESSSFLSPRQQMSHKSV